MAGALRQCGIEVCQTLLHMASTGNRAPDLLIFSPMPYLLGHMLQCIWNIIIAQLVNDTTCTTVHCYVFKTLLMARVKEIST